MEQHFRIIELNSNKSIQVKKPNFGCSLMEFVYFGTDTSEEITYDIYRTPRRLFTIGNYAAPLNIPQADKIKSYFKDNLPVMEVRTISEHIDPSGLWLVNWDKGEMVDLEEYINLNKAEETSRVINPVFLLTAIGNGLSESDYSGPDTETVGRWAGDMISLDKPEAFKNWELRKICPRFEV